MRLYARRLTFAVLLVALILTLPLDAQVLGQRNCTFVCNRSYSGDVATCATARFLGQGNCEVYPTCNIIIVDPDGPWGPATPELRWLCTYDCRFTTCIWV